MTRQERMAEILQEAAEILAEEASLNEGAANAADKEIERKMKETSEELKDYFSGELSKEDGAKKYKELKEVSKNFKKTIDNIPVNSTGEKALRVFSHGMTTYGILAAVGTLFTVGIIAEARTFIKSTPLIAGAIIGTEIGSTANLISYCASKILALTNDTYSRDKALTKWKKFDDKIENAYKLHYADDDD